MSQSRKRRDDEDVCFACFDGGTLPLCNHNCIIQLVLSVLMHSSDQELNGIVVGTYVLLVRRIPLTSVIHVHILFVRVALEAAFLLLSFIDKSESTSSWNLKSI